MKSFFAAIKNGIRNIDPILFASSALLTIISILTIFGSVDNFGKSKLVMQVAMTVVGLVALFIVANLDYSFFVDRFYLIMLIGSAGILAITLIFGITGDNMETTNRSWLTIPVVNIAVQPSEFVKITFLCTFAKHISMVKNKINKPKTLLGLMLHAGLIIGLILLSGDLGVALVYIGIVAVMLFCAGLSGWYFLAAAVLVAIAFPIIWEYFLKPYQRERIIYGFQPLLDPQGYGRQPLMSREAIANGGLFGRGLFGGSIYEDLVASHTDFIFATVCEKFGFIGGGLVIAALVTMAARLIYLAAKTREPMGKLICCGIAGIIILQSVENLWMCLALVPVVGITLPFVSAGGSSMLALYVLMGLAHSVYAKEKKFYFRRGR
jgi:rod shape determining protein RodA